MTEVECVLGDWTFDRTAAALACFRPGERLLPLCWKPDGSIEPVSPADGIVETAPSVALVYHWHVAHHELLRGLIGDYEVDTALRSH